MLRAGIFLGGLLGLVEVYKNSDKTLTFVKCQVHWRHRVLFALLPCFTNILALNRVVKHVTLFPAPLRYQM